MPDWELNVWEPGTDNTISSLLSVLSKRHLRCAMGFCKLAWKSEIAALSAVKAKADARLGSFSTSLSGGVQENGQVCAEFPLAVRAAWRDGVSSGNAWGLSGRGRHSSAPRQQQHLTGRG